MGKNIAVILCGSGYLDGSEIRESVGTLWALSESGATAQCFSPEGPQKDVVNHLSQTPTPENRLMEVEAARIARSQVKPLSELKSSDFDGLAIPGGFGVAKNLCTFAMEGENATVTPQVQSIVQDFHQAQKPILALCIAPMLLALSFKNKTPLSLSLGAEGDASKSIEKWGHQHQITKPDEFHVDIKNKIVTSPAYMYDNASLAAIFKGIHGATRAFLELS